jgi:hypothetical protein
MMPIPFRTLWRGGAAALLLASVVSCGEERATGTVDPTTASLASSPSLVECPTNETLTRQLLVGPLGGLVDIGGTKVTIPAGALSLPTLITLTIPASRYVEIQVRANSLVSFVFDAPVEITLDYSRCTRSDIDRVPLSAWYINAVTKQLLENMNGADDKASRTVKFQTDHLSNYAIAM